MNDGSLTLVSKNQAVLEKVTEKVIYFIFLFYFVRTYCCLTGIEDVLFLEGQPGSSSATDVWLCFENLSMCQEFCCLSVVKVICSKYE